MKKIILIFLGFSLFLLCGCEQTRPEYLISAIGFDKENQEYKVCFEAVIINSETAKQTRKVLVGKGKTPQEAVEKIKRSCTQPLLLAHCGVIAVGEGLAEKDLREVKEYCYDEDPITLSAYFIKTKSAQKLFSVKPSSSVCVGYDVMGLLKQNPKCKNRFFELLSDDEADMPTIAIKDGGVYFASVK